MAQDCSASTNTESQRVDRRARVLFLCFLSLLRPISSSPPSLRGVRDRNETARTNGRLGGTWPDIAYTFRPDIAYRCCGWRVRGRGVITTPGMEVWRKGDEAHLLQMGRCRAAAHPLPPPCDSRRSPRAGVHNGRKYWVPDRWRVPSRCGPRNT